MCINTSNNKISARRAEITGFIKDDAPFITISLFTHIYAPKKFDIIILAHVFVTKNTLPVFKNQ